MRARTVSLLVMTVLLAAGCGDDDPAVPDSGVLVTVEIDPAGEPVVVVDGKAYPELPPASLHFVVLELDPPVSCD